MADQERISYLFEKYLQRQCSLLEIKELVQLLEDRRLSETLMPRLEEIWNKAKDKPKAYPVDWQKMYRQITAHEPIFISGERRMKRRKIYGIAAVFAGLIAASVIIYFSAHHSSKQTALASASPESVHDVPPGGNKAVLILSNGKKVILDQAVNGHIAKQGNCQIIKLDSGELAYQPSSGLQVSPASIQYNTVETPIGGQYQVRLPDGTKVWLNAVSSIRFPTSFIGKERQVVVSGEAYFEVADNPGQPFIVKANNTWVVVLGTHFNINAYTDEANIKTTLLEGSVKVEAGPDDKNAMVIRPGQQVKINSNDRMILVKDADIGEITGWKDGLFVFHDDDLGTVMRRISRWYNVRVEYRNNIIPYSHFTGAIRRDVNLSEVFKMLELTGGATFDIEGRKVIVSE